jgi:hypothetical protein
MSAAILRHLSSLGNGCETAATKPSASYKIKNNFIAFLQKAMPLGGAIPMSVGAID